MEIPRTPSPAQRIPDAPPQLPGHHWADTELRVHFDSPEQAHAAYLGALDRFQHPETWFQSPPVPDALKLHYQLTNGAGQLVAGRGPQPGDHGFIHVGHAKYDDWVHIDQVGVDGDGDAAGMTFRPSAAPTPGTPEGETTHFYTRDATNTMRIWRDGSDVVSRVQIRNVRHNTHAPEMPSARRARRNAVIGAGTELGGQKYMWVTWVTESARAAMRSAGLTARQQLDPRRYDLRSAVSFVPEIYRRPFGLAPAPTGVSDAMAGAENIA